MTLRVSVVATERALSRPASNARSAWHTRSGCTVTLESDSGHSGSGEAVPLPGFSPDTLADCQRALRDFDPGSTPSALGLGMSVIDELRTASSALWRTPAARAALECALLDLWARAAGTPAWALLLEEGAPHPRPRRVATLLMGEPETALAEAQQAYARGVRTFKLKVGRRAALDRELAALGLLRAELGSGVALRLDGNQSFSLHESLEALPRFAAHDPELIEEPCALPDLPRLTGLRVPLALDESLAGILDPEARLDELDALRLKALVLKPSLIGGISTCFAWARVARELDAEVILSHAFEGPIGLASSAALALSIGSERLAQGLDLHGARLEHLHLPFFSGAQIEPWSEPGFGNLVEHGA